VRRGLTVAAVVEAATVTDTDGNVIDTAEFFGGSDRDEGEAVEGAGDAAEVAEDAAPDDTESDDTRVTL
jgi:trigger factor